MISLPGYLVEGLLYESRQSRVYRGRRLADHLPIILKVLNEDISFPKKRARFEQEYQLMRGVKSEAILSAYAMESHHGLQVLVHEDFGGTSVNHLDFCVSLLLHQWLELAIQIAYALAELHRHRIRHKDINPSNIVWNCDTGQVKLIDLGIATELTREMPEIRNPDRLEGTLAYMSPEQTGRMNRSLDYRTDFYSLGVTFYELLTGQLPFFATDALEMVHAHIARQPVPVETVRPGVPAMVSAIITKLMGKTAEDRYQSATGLQADLQTCLDTLDGSGRIPPFVLGSNDFSGRLHISQKLYGRETQLAVLQDIYQRVRDGPAQLLLVAGYSGIGKSALVHEIQKPVARNRGVFIEGKFDQFKRNIPYASISQAFKELIQQLLTKGDAVVAAWKSQLLHVLGNNAQVIIDVIPDLLNIIGPQPAIIDLPAAQAQNRFNHEFRKFVATFATAEHPLVLFLDDLQWADLPSLQLMSLLLRAPALPHLLLIGAYRDNEITSTHALQVTLQEMQKAGAIVHTVTLQPLNLVEVTQLLHDSLTPTTLPVHELAQLSLAKTDGNPFFLNQFLATLVDQEIVRSDPVQGGWYWDIAAVKRAGITDNIVDLLLAKLHKLPMLTQRVLQAAACLGNSFDLNMLALVCELPEIETAQRLWHALQDELIIALDDHYRYAAQASSTGESALVPYYRFLHDRVHQAAYSLCDDAQKAALHLAIGRLWLARYSAEEQQGLLFDLVNHLNQGRTLMTDSAERLRTAQINLVAARRAKASVAYRPALLYLQTALELVGESAMMEHTVATALRHATSLLDQVKVHEVRIQAYITQDKYLEVVRDGLQVLRLLDVTLPRKPKKLHVIMSLMQTRWALRGKKMADLAALPDATDLHVLAARKILSKITSAAYHALPARFPLLPLKSIRMLLQYGHAAPTSACDFAVYGLLLGGVLGDIAQAGQYADLALQLQERPDMASVRSRTTFIVHGAIKPWTTSLQHTLEPLTRSYLCGVELGDVEFAAHAAVVYCYHSLVCGNELSVLERETAHYLQVLSWPTARYVCAIHHKMMMTLMEPRPDLPMLRGHAGGDSLEGALSPEVDVPMEIKAAKSLKFQYFSMRMVMAYLFQDYHAALEWAERAERRAGFAIGFVGNAMFYFYSSLVRLAVLPTGTSVVRIKMLHKIRKSQKKMRHWANYAPENFLQKWHLVNAELARQTGRVLDANRSYEQAIHWARAYDFLSDEALAKELAGAHYLAQGCESIAEVYLREAQRHYRRWGALAKVADLADRYPHWLAEQSQQRAVFGRTTEDINLTSSTASGMLDVATILKASQALSQEIVLEHLLKRLMQLALEGAGAQRGVLLLKNEAIWTLEAEKSELQADATVLQAIALDLSEPEKTPLPSALFHYVVRTRESIVVHDATKDKLVGNDPYVQERQPRSLLIVPILHQADLTGILYLENNAVSGAFSQSRLEMLRLLASQAAISIDNARLYADMEERVAARTAELKSMALRDGLTGVSNRRAFDERLAEELSRSRRSSQSLSLLIIDIDHFKQVNDRFGHPVGDSCLQRVGTTLSAQCRRGADFVARYGGEEFAMILPDTDADGAAAFAERVRAAIQLIVLEVDDFIHPITASFGVATAGPRTFGDIAALIASADRGLYAAKAQGRNCVASAGIETALSR